VDAHEFHDLLGVVLEGFEHARPSWRACQV
jgi:hypothetical protein